MTKVNLSEFKKKFTSYVKELEDGEIVILLNKENKPFARINPVKKANPTKREFGRAKGKYQVTDAFFEPLPEDILKHFK